MVIQVIPNPDEVIAVVVTDLHLTDRKEDEYRWEIFSHLKELSGDLLKGRDRYGCTLFILGDLTDKKDRHQSRFVSRILEEVSHLHGYYNSVVILCGNHDYLYEDSPFFGILEYCNEGEFVSEPRLWSDYLQSESQMNILLLPHSRNPEWDWKQSEAWQKASKLGVDGKMLHAVFCHQTFAGAKFSSGITAEGGPRADIFDDLNPAIILSGDVHVAQKVGKVQYVGSPYPINYGDQIPGRVVVLSLKDGEGPPKFRQREVSLEDSFPKKLVLELDKPEEISNVVLRAGDMVKVRLKTSKSDHVVWPEMRDYIRNFCSDSDVHLKGIELVTTKERRRDAKTVKARNEPPIESLIRYAKRNRISDEMLDAGKALLEGEL